MKLGLLLLAVSLVPLAAAQPDAATNPPPAQPAASAPSIAAGKPADQREFKPYVGDRWIGMGISYGPHRDGQFPGKSGPTRAQMREDLEIMSKHWGMLRMYAIGEETEVILQLIREMKLPMKVMLGAWISAETKLGDGGVIIDEYPHAVRENQRQVEVAARLANEYPDVVLALAVGNETQIFWSAHKVPTHTLIQYIRAARAKTKVPVTTADDFNYWNKPESRIVAREIDFIVTHAYAMWGSQPLERGMPFTQEKFEETARLHPGHTVVLGEAGWATSKSSTGEQAKLIKGAAGEDEQRTFYKQYVEWASRAKVANFYFEAFDEKWKGGDKPEEVEKHWGLFNSDRTPKKALQE